MKTDKTEIGVNKTFRTKVENDFPFFIEKVVSLTDLFEATNCMQIGLKKAHQHQMHPYSNQTEDFALLLLVWPPFDLLHAAFDRVGFIFSGELDVDVSFPFSQHGCLEPVVRSPTTNELFKFRPLEDFFGTLSEEKAKLSFNLIFARLDETQLRPSTLLLTPFVFAKDGLAC